MYTEIIFWSYRFFMSIRNYPLQTAQPSLDSVIDESTVSRVRGLIAKVDNRCRVFGPRPSASEMIDQLGLLSLFLDSNTVTRCKGSLTKTLHGALEVKSHREMNGGSTLFRNILPDRFSHFAWFTELSWNEVENLYEKLVSYTPQSLTDRGIRISSKVVRTVRLKHPEASPELALFMASMIRSSYFSTNKRVSPRKNWVPIDRETLQDLLNALGPGTPADGLLSLMGRKWNTPGMTRLLSQAIWLTGMRPVEAFSCMMFDNRNKREFFELHPAMDRFVRQAGRPAKGSKLLDEGIYRLIQQGFDLRLAEEEKRHLVLRINSAKTRNRSPQFNRSRLLLLREIADSDLRILLMTTCLRKILINHGDYKKCRTACSNQLSQASLQLMPDLEQPITLYHLRHAFINDARKSLPAPEAGALSGHSSVRTLRQYGQKNVRFRQASHCRTWLPQPDPNLVTELRSSWNPRPAQEPNRGVEPECASLS